MTMVRKNIGLLFFSLLIPCLFILIESCGGNQTGEEGVFLRGI